MDFIPSFTGRIKYLHATIQYFYYSETSTKVAGYHLPEGTHDSGGWKKRGIYMRSGFIEKTVVITITLA